MHVLLFFMRHSERADKKLGTSYFSNVISKDPYLTEEGKELAVQVGRKIYAYVAGKKGDTYLPLLKE